MTEPRFQTGGRWNPARHCGVLGHRWEINPRAVVLHTNPPIYGFLCKRCGVRGSNDRLGVIHAAALEKDTAT